MYKILNCLFFFMVATFLNGCSNVQETAKVIWGSSTKALDEARVDALTKTFTCSYEECFQAVLDFANSEENQGSYKYNSYDTDPSEDENDSKSDKGSDSSGLIDSKKEIPVSTYDIFIKDHAKGHIDVMGITGNVNTTEVGIFFTKLKPQETKVEISSLSTTAKVRVSDMVFGELSRLYSEVK